MGLELFFGLRVVLEPPWRDQKFIPQAVDVNFYHYAAPVPQLEGGPKTHHNTPLYTFLAEF